MIIGTKAIYSRSRGNDDYPVAARLLKRLLNLDNSEATVELALMYKEGTGDEENFGIQNILGVIRLLDRAD